MVLEAGDHGPVNSWGRDGFWPLSEITYAQRKDLVDLDALEETVISGNRIWQDREWAIVLDDGSSKYLFGNEENSDEVSGNLFPTKTPYYFIQADLSHSGIIYDDNEARLKSSLAGPLDHTDVRQDNSFRPQGFQCMLDQTTPVSAFKATEVISSANSR
jgi:hypothetical protein